MLQQYKDMAEVTLQFPSIIELIEYEARLSDNGCIMNRSQLTLVGEFSNTDIKSAVEEFGARVIDNLSPKNQLIQKDSDL